MRAVQLLSFVLAVTGISYNAHAVELDVRCIYAYEDSKGISGKGFEFPSDAYYLVTGYPGKLSLHADKSGLSYDIQIDGGRRVERDIEELEKAPKSKELFSVNTFKKDYVFKSSISQPERVEKTVRTVQAKKRLITTILDEATQKRKITRVVHLDTSITKDHIYMMRREGSLTEQMNCEFIAGSSVNVDAILSAMGVTQQSTTTINVPSRWN